MTEMVPFANESDCLQLDELTIENREDRLELYGSLQITRDKVGLDLARQLQQLLNATVAQLESEDLPDQLPPPAVDEVDNPFA
ncbi:hypothetical protein HNQ59_000494 [Chitinivorax tropicus]|uniref:Uncharacterized protein n=2 Tax=Chitinivorax tropicus TaxID=714531 RepID=A0A840MKJ4_9PROT|nr:hypothetical protein [Chitinivorax tropicus]